MSQHVRLIALVLGFLFYFNSHAGVDPFNTYQWNRENKDSKSRNVDKSNWFEWWYYKVVLPETGESFYFVYGIVNPWDLSGEQKGTRSYVGMGDFQSMKTLESTFPANAFTASYSDTEVRVGTNLATDKHFTGHIVEDGHHEAGWDISIEHQWTFNATSWATGRNITNIEWYPAQADALCSGTIYSSGKLVEFQDAPCYQDRNWGTSFPKWWAWIVSNHFENHPDTALAIGGGRPTYWGLPLPFEGVAIGFKHKGKEYSFRPNELNPVWMDIEFGQWEIKAQNGDHQIKISAYAPKESFMDLIFMTPEGELFHDYETLSGQVEVKLYKNIGNKIFKKWKLIETVHSNYAGIEFGSYDTYGIETLFSERLQLQRPAEQ